MKRLCVLLVALSINPLCCFVRRAVRRRRYGVPASAGGVYRLSREVEIFRRRSHRNVGPPKGGTPNDKARCFEDTSASRTVQSLSQVFKFFPEVIEWKAFRGYVTTFIHKDQPGLRLGLHGPLGFIAFFCNTSHREGKGRAILP